MCHLLRDAFLITSSQVPHSHSDPDLLKSQEGQKGRPVLLFHHFLSSFSAQEVGKYREVARIRKDTAGFLVVQFLTMPLPSFFAQSKFWFKREVWLPGAVSAPCQCPTLTLPRCVVSPWEFCAPGSSRTLFAIGAAGLQRTDVHTACISSAHLQAPLSQCCHLKDTSSKGKLGTISRW